MIKKVFYIDDSIASEAIEGAMRSRALKRTRPLDIKSSTSYAGTDGKYFLGYEKENSVDFMRIRSPFEFFLPKVVISFNKDDFKKYSLRYNPISTIILLFIVLGIILNTIYSISAMRMESDFPKILTFGVLFMITTIIEVLLNKYYIRRTITKYIYESKSN